MSEQQLRRRLGVSSVWRYLLLRALSTLAITYIFKVAVRRSLQLSVVVSVRGNFDFLELSLYGKLRGGCG